MSANMARIRQTKLYYKCRQGVGFRYFRGVKINFFTFLIQKTFFWQNCRHLRGVFRGVADTLFDFSDTKNGVFTDLRYFRYLFWEKVLKKNWVQKYILCIGN